MNIVTVLTDFGLKDLYVGVMKGVILSINPHAGIVDMTHEVEPQDIREGAFLLQEYRGYFPTGTVHLCVVDPTVGSERRPIALAKDGHLFVGPDNGLFSLIIDDGTTIHRIEHRKYMLEPVSATFHGRDIFSPAAAYLSLGLDPALLGSRVTDPVRLSGLLPEVSAGTLIGEIIRFDRFGNAISNIHIAVLNTYSEGKPVRVTLNGVSFSSLSRSYYEGKTVCLAGSSGYLEFGTFKGNFAKEHRTKKGDKVVVTAKRSGKGRTKTG